MSERGCARLAELLELGEMHLHPGCRHRCPERRRIDPYGGRRGLNGDEDNRDSERDARQ